MEIYSFEPYLKSVIWGGDKIKTLKNIDTTQECIGESWEISGVSGHESVVANGTDKGRNLTELIDKYKSALVGTKVFEKFGNEFPLLIKIIDARRDLSVQVHPDDELARKRHNSYGKTEMWYIMDSEPNAKIYAGLSKSITPEDYERLVAEKKIMDAVAEHASAPGNVYFLPAGRIHAIGAGNLLAEIQQTSDITYRVYDFDRRDARGNTRELHTELAKDAIDYHVYNDYETAYDRNATDEIELVKCEYFTVDKLCVEGTETAIYHNPESFTIVICEEGECILTADDCSIQLKRGSTVLVPASAQRLTASGSAVLLTARL